MSATRGLSVKKKKKMESEKYVVKIMKKSGNLSVF